jgi:ATP-dependent protease ClpP protease subunit
VLVPCALTGSGAGELGVRRFWKTFSEQWNLIGHQGSLMNTFRCKETLALLMILFVFCFPTRAGTIRTEKCQNDEGVKNCYYHYTGIIQANDVMAFRNALEKTKKSGTNAKHTIFLDSPGGSVASAVEIGMLLRSFEATTSVPIGSSCASSCVFMLAAGVVKYSAGDIYVHRPYSDIVGDIDLKDIAKERSSMIVELKRYFKGVNIPESLLEVIEATPPERLRKLSNSELIHYGLAGVDPVYQEKMDAQCAAQLKISRTEIVTKRAACLSQQKGKFGNILCNPCKNWSPTSGIDDE